LLFLILGGLAKLRKLFLTRLYSNCSRTPDFRPLLGKGFKGLYQHLIQNKNPKFLSEGTKTLEPYQGLKQDTAIS